MIATPRWRAPRQDGSVLAEPPLGKVGRLLAENARLFEGSSLSILGKPVRDLRIQARQEVLQSAAAYLKKSGEPLPEVSDAPLLLAGHQPELFHPGVWVKNFALNGLARQHGLQAVNLVVDNDTVKSTALRLPARSPDSLANGSGSVHLTSIPFDNYTGEEIYEERKVKDEALFGSFAERAGEVLRDWDFAPMLPAFWSEVQRQGQRTPLLGERFAAARRTYERQWGCHNWEVPLSDVCQTEAFAWFACHLLSDLPRLHEVYNWAVHEYRKLHKLRSKNHPVPDLVVDGAWYEVPFWGWRVGQTQRNRLFARQTATAIELRNGNEPWPALPRSGDPKESVSAWHSLGQLGCKVRSRALTTTLFARVFVAELFIHGIGGGKYDELTDEIMRRLYQMEPPAFEVLSATLLLPLPAAAVKSSQRGDVVRQVRELHCNPQRHLNGIGPDQHAADLIAQKRDWITQQPSQSAQRRERFRTLQKLTEQLRPYVSDQEAKARANLAGFERQLADNEILERRDYAFCFFPEAKLRELCTKFLNG